MSLDYNEKQGELVRTSEEAHFHGLRSTSLTGPYTELLFLHFLQKEFPDYAFGRGNILKEVDEDGYVKRGKTRQIDIICYRKDRAYFEYGDYVSVKKEDVLLTFEVKKWSSNNQFQELESKIENFEKEEHIKMFAVIFRIWESETFNLKKIGEKKGVYIFSHSIKNEQNDQNHMIRLLNNKDKQISDYIYLGQLKRLVDDMRSELGSR